MSTSDPDPPATVRLQGDEVALEEVAERMQEAIDETMTPDLRDDIVDRLRELLTLRCREHDEPPEIVESDEKGLRVETCCHDLMNRVNELWSR